MMGPVIGDIVGSVYEGRKKWMRLRHVDFEPFFHDDGRIADDTLLTAVVAASLMGEHELVAGFKDAVHTHPTAGWGRRFREWAESNDDMPYGSWGNGAAMRVAPVGWAYDDVHEVEQRARDVSVVTHDHPDAIKGAQAVAIAIWHGRQGAAPWEWVQDIERRFQYDLSQSVDDIRPTYVFDSSAAGTVPQALTCVLEADDFEHAVRLAVSLGGDTDTLASMAGAVAEAVFGIPQSLVAASELVVPDEVLDVIQRFEAMYGHNVFDEDGGM